MAVMQIRIVWMRMRYRPVAVVVFHLFVRVFMRLAFADVEPHT